MALRNIFGKCLIFFAYFSPNFTKLCVYISNGCIVCQHREWNFAEMKNLCTLLKNGFLNCASKGAALFVLVSITKI